MEQEEVIRKVLNVVSLGKDIFHSISTTKQIEYYCIPLDCSKLIDTEKLPESVIEHFYSNLHAKDTDDFSINYRACLYFYEFTSHSSTEIEDKYKSLVNERNKSAIKKVIDKNTNILYVGKVKTNIGGRMATHFGYGHRYTGGMQLRFWAKDMNLQLMVHIIAFKEDIGDFVNPLELLLSKELKPLIGKSR